MKSPHQKLLNARKNLVTILQIATRPDLTPEEIKLLKNVIRTYEQCVAANERKVAALRPTMINII